MLSVWLLVAAIVILPVLLRIWAEPDDPGNGIVHHSDTPEDDEDEPEGMLAAA